MIINRNRDYIYIKNVVNMMRICKENWSIYMHQYTQIIVKYVPLCIVNAFTLYIKKYIPFLF